MNIFGGNTGVTYEQLQKRRELANALIEQNMAGTPRNVGEGLAAIGRAIAARAIDKRADKRDSELKSEFDAKWGSIFGAPSGGYSAPSYSPAPPKDPNSPEGIAGDAMVALGKRSPYADAIAAVESAGSGDYSAIGPITKSGDRAYGRYGVMGANVGPWTEKYLGKRMTPKEFLASPEAQDAVFNGEFGSYVQKYGNPQDAASMWFSGRPMAEAGNASDGYNTVPQYVDKFTSAMGGPERVMPAGGNMNIQALADVVGSPYASPGQKAIAQALLQQQMQAADPKSALELENMRLQNEALKNPPKKDNRTSDMLEYDRAVLDYIQRGQPVPTFTEWTRGNKASGAASQTVNVNGETGPRIGTIPQGYQLTQDPVSGAYRMEAIPGGPEDTSKKEAAAESNAVTASEVVTTAAARAREAARNRNFGSVGTSFIAGLPIIGALTDSGEVMRQVEVLKSMAKVENLTAMRAASPTGGALGGVTEKEADMLAAKSGALDPNSPNFERDLDDYERTLLRVIHGKEAGDRIFEQTRGAGWQSATGGSPRLRFNPETGDLEPVQ